MLNQYHVVPEVAPSSSTDPKRSSIPYMRLLLSGGRCEAFAGDSQMTNGEQRWACLQDWTWAASGRRHAL